VSHPYTVWLHGMARDVGIVTNIRIIKVGDSSIGITQVVETDGLQVSSGARHLEILCNRSRNRRLEWGYIDEIKETAQKKRFETLAKTSGPRRRSGSYLEGGRRPIKAMAGDDVTFAFTYLGPKWMEPRSLEWDWDLTEEIEGEWGWRGEGIEPVAF
jgi:hypothetical protein